MVGEPVDMPRQIERIARNLSECVSLPNSRVDLFIRFAIAVTDRRTPNTPSMNERLLRFVAFAFGLHDASHKPVKRRQRKIEIHARQSVLHRDTTR